MTLVLIGFCAVLLVVCAFFGYELLNMQKKAKRFNKIENVEEHLKHCQSQAEEAKLNFQSYAGELNKAKTTYAKYTQILGPIKSIGEATERLNKCKSELSQCQSILGIVRDATEAKAKFQQFKTEIDQQVNYLRSELVQVSDAANMEAVGIYVKQYKYDVPAEVKERLDRNAAQQKEMVRQKTACTCPIEWQVEGSLDKGRKMINDKINLMLRAFNGECDAAIAKVTFANLATMEARIAKAFNSLNKLGETNQVSLSPAYLELRLQELRLVNAYEQAKEAERERQREIKAQMAEEEKAQREIEKAKKDAERDENLKAKALEEARKQLADEHGKHNEKLAALVAKLESELKDAIDRKVKATARASLTRSGHVYILSNVGTMGADRYKIGMTRRLVPDERVKELGDASVPFPFDVHAMIYSVDAPALEAALHRKFNDRRVNMVNTRKEYFDVTLPEIIGAVSELHGIITFVTEPPAEQYKQTLVMKAAGETAEMPEEDLVSAIVDD